MSLSSIDDILTAVRSAVDNLALTMDNAPILVVKDKAPEQREGLDPTTKITVSKSERPEEVSRYSFTKRRIDWFVDVTLVTPHESSLADQSLIRSRITDLFSRVPLAGAPDIYDMEILPQQFTDREAQQLNWDTQVTTVRCSVVVSNT